MRIDIGKIDSKHVPLALETIADFVRLLVDRGKIEPSEIDVHITIK